MTASSYSPSDLRTSWRKEALCGIEVRINPDLDGVWDSDDELSRAIADPICDECPVQRLCLADAVKDQQSEGNRGGFFFKGGRLAEREKWLLHRDFGIRARVRHAKRAGEETTDEEIA